jgi:hypothetical protein
MTSFGAPAAADTQLGKLSLRSALVGSRESVPRGLLRIGLPFRCFD